MASRIGQAAIERSEDGRRNRAITPTAQALFSGDQGLELMDSKSGLGSAECGDFYVLEATDEDHSWFALTALVLASEYKQFNNAFTGKINKVTVEVK